MSGRGQGSYGVCPNCGRTVSGRADGIERTVAEKRFVVLGPHTRRPRGGGACLTRGSYVRVPKVPRPADHR